jgi:hypothetical protein
MRRIGDLQRDIETGVADLVAGEGWQRWLAVAARFPKYSFRNQLLIRHQRPNARLVMGYRAWQAHGHQVRRGEQSISILAPCTYKTKSAAESDGGDATEEVGEKRPRRVLRGFRVAHVFDIAQTDGDNVELLPDRTCSRAKHPPDCGIASPTRSPPPATPSPEWRYACRHAEGRHLDDPDRRAPGSPASIGLDGNPLMQERTRPHRITRRLDGGPWRSAGGRSRFPAR